MTIALVIIAATIIGLLGGWTYAGFPLPARRERPSRVTIPHGYTT